MPEQLENISNSAFNELESATQRAVNIVPNQLNAYSREFQNKALSALDAKKKELEAKATEFVKGKADNYFKFVLNSFGLKNVKATEYKAGSSLDSKNSDVGSNFSYQDKGVPNMHTGATTPPTSVLGTPVFADVILSKTTKIDYSYGSEVVKKEVHLMWALLDVSQTKNIVKTAIQGRDGTVKEYISDGDYMVTIRGAFSSTFKLTYPKELVANLIKLCKEKTALDVTSEYLLMFGIHQLVIDSYKFSQEEGKQNIQKFELQCSSDVPLILKKQKSV
ncbi:MAG: hypothetical protein JSR11_03610 [Bacteroidetes bacterium]|nr:hypothetical protein [Bacteroidota bacterium]